jgi:UDP-N-acetylglucosamine 2-epimerase (non-hydrolysing)
MDTNLNNTTNLVTKILRQENLKDKICVVVGTRPGIIKFGPIIRELEKRRVDSFIFHTGQHYSFDMDKVFFRDLSLPEPRYKLEVMKRYRTHGAQTGEMLKGVETALIEEKPKIVLVGGDANTNLAGALAARKLQIKVGHIEAGLRSHDWQMPEEHNRVMIDHISELLFAPTEKEKDNLIEDNVKGQIFVVGNTIVDAVYQAVDIAKTRSSVLGELGLGPNDYFLLTLHREETVDYPENFQRVLEGIDTVIKEFQREVIFPIHPRARNRAKEFSIEQKLRSIKGLRIITPLGYLDFLWLLSNARLVLTDSGGIQEESCILRVPCVTLRGSTERPQTVEAGANYVAGLGLESILRGVSQMLETDRKWINPLGDGKAAQRIIDIVEEVLGRGPR